MLRKLTLPPLCSQLGLPHDEFTFSKNIFNPSSPHFGYFTEPTLFGMVTAENQLVYNLDANTVQIDEGTEKGANLEKGKASFRNYMMTWLNDKIRQIHLLIIRFIL